MTTVTIKPDELYEAVKQGANSNVLYEMSSYDMPREVEGSYDFHSGVLHLTFKYADQEVASPNDFVPQSMPHNIKIMVGKHSGKILGIEVPVSDTQRERMAGVISQLDNALDSTIPTLRKFNQKANFQVVKHILDRQGGPLLSFLTGPGLHPA